MQRIAVYQNTTGIAERLELLCRGEQLAFVREQTEKELFRDIRIHEVQMILLDVTGEEKGTAVLTLIASLRRQSRIPIMVIVQKMDETMKVSALSIGADDYVSADDNILVILARIKSQLRRYTQLTAICANLSQIYKVDGLEINDLQKRVIVDGKEVKLTPTEYEILKLLVMEKGKVLSIHQIYEDIWKMQAVDVDNTVAVHVRHIREKIELNPRKPRYLKVIWGTGYMVG